MKEQLLCIYYIKILKKCFICAQNPGQNHLNPVCLFCHYGHEATLNNSVFVVIHIIHIVYKCRVSIGRPQSLLLEAEKASVAMYKIFSFIIVKESPLLKPIKHAVNCEEQVSSSQMIVWGR